MADRVIRTGVIALLALALGGVGCETAIGPRPVVPSRALIGVIRVLGGPAVFLNGASVPTGTSAFDGDRLSTGPASQAIIDLAQGGFLQLDENTDPFFEYLRNGACLLIKGIGAGQVRIAAHDICVQDVHGTQGLDRSDVNWQVTADSSIITVADGTLTLTAPIQRTLTRGEQATVRAGRVSVVTLSPERLRAVTAWQQKFRGAGVTPPPLSPPGAVAPRLVPRLVGRHVDDARAVLRREGFREGRVVEQFTGRASAGTVLRTDPGAGVPGRPDMSVDLVVESASVVLTPANADTIVKILNAVNERLNRATAAHNANNVAAAEAETREARIDFERLEREFRSAGAGRGPLQELYDLATASRQLQKALIELSETQARARRSNNRSAVNAAVEKANAEGERYNANIKRINQILQSLPR